MAKAKDDIDETEDNPLEQALIAALQKIAAKNQPDTTVERQEAQREMETEHERQRKEVHYWITFHRQGDNDNVDMVDIGAAGVMYHIRKGTRVPLPQSAINCLKLAERVGLDHGHPVYINGKKFLKPIRESDYSYQIEGTCSAEEAAAWREEQARRDLANSGLVPIASGEENLIEVGSY